MTKLVDFLSSEICLLEVNLRVSPTIKTSIPVREDPDCPAQEYQLGGALQAF